MPPADPPRASRSKPRRKPRQATQPPSSTARQNAAFGSRKARPLPKPKPAPAAQPRRGTTPAPVRVVQRAARAQKPAPVPKPSAARQARNARAQQAGYVSQGKAVSKAAAQQRRVAQARAIAALPSRGGGGGDFDASLAPTRNRPAADAAAAVASKRIGHRIYLGGDNHYYAHVKRAGLPDRHIPVDPFTGKVDRRYQADPRSGGIEAASVNAPALKVLDQTTRPIHAIAGAAKEDVKVAQQKGVAHYLTHGGGAKARKAAVRGAELKDRALFSDVLKQAGVKNKGVAAAGGFALDVVADPTTYLTGGTGSIAEHAAARAGAKVAAKAAKAGMSEEGAATVARAAARRAAENAPAGKGVTVKLAGQEVPGVRRATAAVARGVKKPLRKVAPVASRTVPAAVRRVVREVAPQTRQAGVSEAAHIGARQATRQARASVNTAEARAMQLAQDLRRKLSDEDYGRVADAVDRNDLSGLAGPEYRKALRETKGDRAKARELLKQRDPKSYKLVEAADTLRRSLKGSRRLSRRAGVAAGSTAGDTSKYLAAADLKRLDKTVQAEQRAQKRNVSRQATREQQSREQALLAEQSSTLRTQGAQKAAETRVEASARIERERLAGQARAATEKVRGQEARRVAVGRERSVRQAQVVTANVRGQGAKTDAVSRERAIGQARAAVVEARRRLKVELARPVTKRRGVAGLEVKVRQAEQTWRDAKRPVNVARMSAVRPQAEAPAAMSAIRPRAIVPGVGPIAAKGARRAQQTAERYGNRAADTLAAQRSLGAAQAVPKLKSGESHAAYLQRVINHANQHDLSLIKQRAEKLLQKVPQDVAKGYFPREFEPRVLKKLGLTPEEAATRTVRAGTAPSRTVSQTTAGFARNEQRALRTVNPERVAKGQEPFSTNVPLVALNHLKSAARATSQGEFAKHMANLGRKVSSVDDLQPGEGLFKLGYQGGKFGLHEVRGLPVKPTKGGQYVALDRRMLEDMKGAVQQVRSGNPVGQVLDKVTGRWKRLATATPGFHIRNIIGDTSQAYLAAPGHELPRNIGQAGKAVRRANQQAKSLAPPASHATIKVAGQRQPLDGFLKSARGNGVLDSGYIGSEVHDLVEPTAEKASRVKRTKGTVNRWMTNRENLMRLATYKAGLDRGMKPAEAADLANHFHIDYGDLSDTERRYLRRVFPFYTWTARTLPVMAKALVTQPGKFATIEKAREETSSGFGLNEAAVRRGMSEAISRQVPFVIKVGNSAAGVSASLPVTLLNEFPTGASKQDLSAYLSELGRFSFQMLNPLFKVPIEEQTGVSLYTKRPIEDPKRPLTAAPSWVAYLPDAVKRELEVTPDYVDKRTGKKAWGWRGQADYVSRQLPGAPQQVSTLASGGRPGQPKDTATTVIGAAGVRVDSLNAAAVKRTAEVKVLEQLAKLNRRAGELNQQGITSDNATPEYRHLRAQINALTKQVRPRKSKAKARAGGGNPLLKQSVTGGGNPLLKSSGGGSGNPLLKGG